jgi:PTH1 family peptidyl-tRNA hydrolase
MLILAGLGNPGAQYAHNRHNIGFMAIDALARRWPFASMRSKFQGQAAEGAIDGVKALLLKPQTFMNESGRAIGEAMKFYKLTPAEVVVFYDELDLAPGRRGGT